MALTVGELVGYLRLDGSQFDQKLDESGRRFSGLRDNVSSGTRVLATAFASTTVAAGALGAAVFKVGLDYNRLQQTSRAALATLLGSAEAANAQMDKLDDFARNSPFAKDVFIRAQQQLLGFGREAEEVIPILDAVQNAVAAVGGSNNDISELVEIIAKVGAQGKFTAVDLMQFGRRGVDAAALIGSEMGKTGAEIREMITKNEITSEEAIKHLTTAMMERFGGATANIKQQFDGAADRVKAAWRDIGSVIAAPFIDPKGGGRAVGWVNALADAMRALENKARPTVDLLVRRFAPGMDRVEPTLDRVRRSIEAWDISKLNGQIDRLAGYAPLLAGVSTALFTLGTNNIGILQKLGLAGINPVLAGIAALVATSPELRRVGQDFLGTLSELRPEAEALGSALAETALEVLTGLTPALQDLLGAAAPVIVALVQGLTPGLLAVLDAASPAVDILAQVVSFVADLPGPVLAAGAAFLLLRTHVGSLNRPLVLATESMMRFGQQARVQAALGNTNVAVGGLATASMNARGAVTKLSTAMRTAFISNPVGLALAGLAAAFTAISTNTAEAKARTEDYRNTLDDLGRRTEDTIRRINDALSEERTNWLDNLFGKDPQSLIDDAERLGLAIEDLQGYILGEEEAIRRVVAAREAYIGPEAMGQERRDRNARKSWVEDFVGALDREASALSQAEREAAKKARADEAAGIATDGARSSVEAHVQALKDQVEAQREAAGGAVSLREAQIQLAEAQDRVNEEVAEGTKISRDNTGAVDLGAEATRKADRALLDLWNQQDRVTEAMRRNNESASVLDATIREQREAFILAATQMGYTAREAEELADSYGLIPNHVMTEIKTEGFESATRQIDRWIRDNSGRRIQVRVEANTGNVSYNYGAPQSARANGGVWDGKVKAFADGGVTAAGNRVPRVPQIVAGGTNILWGEEETGWEAYISGKPGARLRNLQVLDEAARRLGRVVLPMADGGTLGRPAPTQKVHDGSTGDTYIIDGLTLAASDLPPEVVEFFRNLRRHARQNAGV